MLDVAKVKAISIDLDDTLWPIWPTIERAEKALHDWLAEHAPMAAALFSSPSALREIRDYMAASRPEEYSRIMHEAHLPIAAFGGTFLMMVALTYFFDHDKEIHWVHWLESRLSRYAEIKGIEIAFVLLVMLGLSLRALNRGEKAAFAELAAPVSELDEIDQPKDGDSVAVPPKFREV